MPAELPGKAKRLLDKSKAVARTIRDRKERRALFVQEYLRNGHNGTRAAMAAGCPLASARKRSSEWLKEPDIKELVAEQAREVAEQSELSVMEWARELKALAFSNAGALFNEEGKVLHVNDMPEATRRAISSIDILPDGSTKIKFWSKTAALETMAKHLGLFELDNSQKKEDVSIKVLMVG